MTDRLMHMSCERFAEELAAKKSVPGGGGAAAFVGALGAALCSMVGNYTVGKAAYAAVEDDVQGLLQRSAAVCDRLLDLVEEDARAFEPLARAYAIPRDDPERERVLEAATMSACHAPLEMMRQICVVVDLLKGMAEKGSTILQSDVACGAILCRGALEAAAVNVYVNSGSLKDRVFAESIECECDDMLKVYRARAEGISSCVIEKIRERIGK